MKKTVSSKDFEEIYQILTQSFPKNELRKKLGFAALANNSSFNALVERKGGKIIGFIGFWQFESFGFIEYFAVLPDYRGNGTGTKMLNTLLKSLKVPVVLEVEPADYGKIAEKRISYYEKMGFNLCNFEYFQPAYSKEQNKLKLLIMSYPTTPSDDCFNEYKKEVYKKVYNVNF